MNDHHCPLTGGPCDHGCFDRQDAGDEGPILVIIVGEEPDMLDGFMQMLSLMSVLQSVSPVDPAEGIRGADDEELWSAFDQSGSYPPIGRRRRTHANA